MLVSLTDWAVSHGYTGSAARNLIRRGKLPEAKKQVVTGLQIRGFLGRLTADDPAGLALAAQKNKKQGIQPPELTGTEK